MDELGQQLFERTLAVAAGERTRGEAAGHSQVSIWRDWPQRNADALEQLLATPAPTGEPLAIRTEQAPDVRIDALDTPKGAVLDRIGLVLPTSLCSGQIARLAAQRLNQGALPAQLGLSRFAALVHTEGCGVSGGANEDIYARMLLGYLTHPSVALALLLEHGCEKTHNDYMRAALDDAGVDAERYGFASVQLDGGIDRVLARIEAWFTDRAQRAAPPQPCQVGLAALRLGMLAGGDVSEGAAQALAQLVRWIVNEGGTVVIPEGAGLADCPPFRDGLVIAESSKPTIAHGQVAARAGIHLMEAPTEHWTESLSGLGASGVQVLLAHVGEHPRQGHPMIPTLQVSAATNVMALYSDDLDARLEGDEEAWGRQLLDLVIEVASRRRQPRLWERGVTDFQITRGLLGVSM
jgi:altronate dehydratase